MATITPQNGRSAFITAQNPHTYWELNSTNLGTNFGDDTSGNATNTNVAAADISTSDSYEGMNQQNDPPSSGWFDIYIVTDAGGLFYFPSGMTVGSVYGLFHNGGGTHAQSGFCQVTALGVEVCIEHNNAGTDQDNMKFLIPNADLDGWHSIGFQYASHGGVQGDIALWHNGAVVCSGTRAFALAYGSGNPDFGASTGDEPTLIGGISPYGVDATWSNSVAITGTGILIANFTCDNPANTNTTPNGGGDTWHTDYYDMHTVTVSNLTPVITDAEDEAFDVDETNIILTGTDFIAAQGTGKLEIGDNSSYATATKVLQAVDTWGDTSIQFDLSLGSFSEVTLWLFVTNNDDNVSAGYPVTILRVPDISNIEDEIITTLETDVDIDGVYFGASQGLGKVEMSNNSVYGSGTLVEQTVNAWGDLLINVDITQGALSVGINYFFVTGNNGKVSTAFAVSLEELVQSDGLYKTGNIIGVLNNQGYTTTVFLIRDDK